MNKLYTWLSVGCVATSLNVARAQFGASPQGPDLSGALSELFGENKAFTATLEMTARVNPGMTMTLPGKIAFLDGKTRFEMDMTAMKMPGSPVDISQQVTQMKAMGMDKMVALSLPDKKSSYVIFPSMKAYARQENPADASGTNSYKMESKEVGKETVDGHACIKNEVTITESSGKTHEATVWNATDLKKFPVKIETAEAGQQATLLFKDIKLAKPEASVFNLPADFTSYDSTMALMQQEVMKRMGGAGAPPGN